MDVLISKEGAHHVFDELSRGERGVLKVRAQRIGDSIQAKLVNQTNYMLARLR
jgi:hypothetical protein